MELYAAAAAPAAAMAEAAAAIERTCTKDAVLGQQEKTDSNVWRMSVCRLGSSSEKQQLRHSSVKYCLLY